MKTLLITTLLAIVTLTTVPAVRAEINAATVSNSIETLKRTADQAQAALSNAEKLAGIVLPATSTNTPAATVAPTNTPPSTNGFVATTKATINDAVIDILHGVKAGSGEIYQASKTAITKAVDFTMEQAPIVVNEFLHWKMAEAIIYLVAWSIPAIILLCIARAFNKRSNSADVPKEDRYKTDQNDYAILKWIFRSVALVFLTLTLVNYGMTVVKIAVAPRVYLIEYVVSTVHNGVPPSQ
jgi:hypothetical protein